MEDKEEEGKVPLCLFGKSISPSKKSSVHKPEKEEGKFQWGQRTRE